MLNGTKAQIIAYFPGKANQLKFPKCLTINTWKMFKNIVDGVCLRQILMTSSKYYPVPITIHIMATLGISIPPGRRIKCTISPKKS